MEDLGGKLAWVRLCKQVKITISFQDEALKVQKCC